MTQQTVRPPPGFEWLSEPVCCNPYDFVSRIAASVFPQLDRRSAEKRVRARIGYGFKQKKGFSLQQCHSALGKPGEVLTEEFYRWALAAYPDLYKVDWIHRHWKSRQVAVACEVRWDAPTKPSPPLTADQLKIRDLQKLIEDKDRENSRLTAEIAGLRGQLTKFKEKEAATKAKRSTAGKRGGRGNSKW